MVALFRKKIASTKDDLFSGLTVALALVPEAVAFAFVAGVDPLVGLYAAFMIGLITSVFGGRPGMISGATGALAVVMVSLVQKGNQVGLTLDQPVENLGLYYLFISVIFMGVFQMLAGVFKLGKFIRLIPHPVMMGFVNGLAIVIFLAQLNMFKENVDGVQQWMSIGNLATMLSYVGATMLIMFLMQKFVPKIPAALTAIVVVSAVVIFFKVDVTTVGSYIKAGGGTGLEGGLPEFQTAIFSDVPWNFEMLKTILPYSLILAAVGLIESLLTLNLIDEITETRGNGNRECAAQGLANIVTGFFGGMGGCAMIGQSIINVNAGGRGRLSGIVAALALLSFILFASPLIELVPIPVLVGVMFMVVIGTFAWSSFRIINKIPVSDAIVLILVSALTVFFDLAIAVIAGIIVSALVFSWQNAVRIRARKYLKPNGIKVYEIWGPLFFGSVATFTQKFDPKNDPDEIEIDFIESKVSDHSGIKAIEGIIDKYLEQGKMVKLRHLSDDCKKLLKKMNPAFEKYIDSGIEDPRYFVVTNPANFK